MSRSPAVDTYVAKSAEFARPILTRVRAAMRKACPQIEETIKWGVPHFEYKGVVAYMAALKTHARFGFWKQRLMNDPAGLFKAPGSSGMGGKKFRSISWQPSKKNVKARASFEAFTPAQQREYVEWLTEAKQEETRKSRLEQAIQWMAEGKTRHWKYQDC